KIIYVRYIQRSYPGFQVSHFYKQVLVRYQVIGNQFPEAMYALDSPASKSMVCLLCHRFVTQFENGIPVTLGREIIDWDEQCND
ncbi:MAG: hypothetical protein OES70_16750, partial [Desulfobacterales bacterium]|nr:hypothetical protein [Desulfobacterales bacterium]